MRYYQVLLRVSDENEMDEEDIKAAIEDTLEYLPYELSGTVEEVKETDEDI